jgi:hypothetical protein
MLEVDSLFRRSAKAMREAQITQTGCIHFLMQAYRLIVYYNNYSASLRALSLQAFCPPYNYYSPF